MTWGNAGIPRPFAEAAASAWKAFVLIVTVGMPRFSISMLSWIHHAVQEPQLPRPLITASALAVRSSIASGVRGIPVSVSLVTTPSIS